MDTSSLERKPEIVRAVLKTLHDGSVITTKPLKIYFPERFEEKNLAEISNVVSVLGILGLVVDDKYYAVMNIPATVRIQPTYINKTKIDDQMYYELEFDKNSTVYTTNEVVKKDLLPYYIYDEMIGGGRVPWYMDYSDVLKVFDDSPHYNGICVGHNYAVMDMVASSICRDPADMTKFYRHIYTDVRMEKTKRPMVLPLKNVSTAASNTTAKLLGSYFSDGVTSALINPSNRSEVIEDKLRR